MENKETIEIVSEHPAQKKLNNLHFILNALLVISIILLIFFCINKLGLILSDNNSTNNPQINSQNDNFSLKSLKVQLLNSNNLNSVTRGAGLDFIPENDMNIEPGSTAFNFQFYGINLSEEQNAKFINFAHPAKEFSSNFPVINETKLWSATMPSDGEILLTKNGYLCKIPPDFGPSLCASDNTSCIYPDFKGIKCAYIKKPIENNIKNVSKFILDSLNEAGIYCNDQCAIKKIGNEEVIVGNYSSRILYFQNINSLDKNKNAELVKAEAKKSLNYFKESGWEAHDEDITDEEQQWDQGVSSSIQIKASNNNFNCVHAITISTSWSKLESETAVKRDKIECSIRPSMLGQVEYLSTY